jgi:hypothetical protein
MLRMTLMKDLKSFIVPIAMVVTLTLATSALAQESSQASRKIDEFIGEVDREDLIARLDNFAIEVQNQPSALGHIIVYRSRRHPPSVSQRYALLAKDYLVKVRGIDRNKLVTMDGGRSGCLMYELWIVPPGAAPPERRFTYKYPLEKRPSVRRRP